MPNKHSKNMKNILLVLAFLFIAYSCSDGNSTIPGEEEEEEPGKNKPTALTISLKAKKEKGNIFDLMEFYMMPDRNCTLYDIKETYDSLLWRVQGKDETFKLSEQTNSSSSVIFGWSHSFYKAGRYYTIMDGYKDGKVILSDTTVVDVEDKRDFLYYNWEDITSTILHFTGNVNVLDNDFKISFRPRFIDNSPSVYVNFRVYDIIKDEEEVKKYHNERQEKLVLKYISGFYGEPKLSYEKDNTTIEEAFHTIFEQEEDFYSPRYIWQAPTANIVLLKSYDELGEYYEYCIYAEPIKD